MRVWDVAAGYLSRQSLLGEHRELHGLYSILIHDKVGYSRHPETIRWVGCANALVRRHDLLAAEMRLRGYHDRTPLASDARRRTRWPASFVTSPIDQFLLLDSKYAAGTVGRIRLPRTTQDLWAQHKYSVMARDPDCYRDLGRRAARLKGRAGFPELSRDLVAILRQRPPRGPLANAVEHMWGYVARDAARAERHEAHRSLEALLDVTAALAMRRAEPYLVASTALSELSIYLRNRM